MCFYTECATFDFENGDLAGWTRTGTAFDNQPTFGDNSASRNGGASNHQGNWWIGTFENRPSQSHTAGATQGDGPQGTLTSPLLRLTGESISFLIAGGGGDRAVGVQLLVDGAVTDRFFVFTILISSIINIHIMLQEDKI